MPCYHPLLRVWDNQVGDWRVRPFPHDLRPGFDPMVYKKSNQLGYAGCAEGYPGAVPYMVIPCGKCVGCRMEYSRQWANRCMLELEYHDSAYFVTLTYNDYHVPRVYYPDPETGEAQLALSLCKRDVQLFMKRLRDHFPDDNIRFFMCGEYGPSSWRPHYHLILFGLHLNDLVYAGTRRGNNYYKSSALERVWSRKQEIPNLLGDTCVTPLTSMGFVEVGEVTWNTCAYTARYIMKKLKGPESEFYERFNLVPPFVLMSRKPGIARQWYDDHPDYTDYDFINIKTPQGGRKFRAPQYFGKLHDVQYPAEAPDLHAARQRIATEAIKAKLMRTDLSYLDYLRVQEDKFKSRISSLKREEI